MGFKLKKKFKKLVKAPYKLAKGSIKLTTGLVKSEVKFVKSYANFSKKYGPDALVGTAAILYPAVGVPLAGAYYQSKYAKKYSVGGLSDPANFGFPSLPAQDLGAPLPAEDMDIQPTNITPFILIGVAILGVTLLAKRKR